MPWSVAAPRNAIADAVLFGGSTSSGGNHLALSGKHIARTWESDLPLHQWHATDFGAHDQNAVRVCAACARDRFPFHLSIAFFRTRAFARNRAFSLYLSYTHINTR